MDIQSIIETILGNFNFGLVISINVLVYAIIKLSDYITKQKTPKWIKIAATVVSSIVLGIVYYHAGNVSTDVILSSCVCAPLIWDWIIKPILEKFKKDYKKEVE